MSIETLLEQLIQRVEGLEKHAAPAAVAVIEEAPAIEHDAEDVAAVVEKAAAAVAPEIAHDLADAQAHAAPIAAALDDTPTPADSPAHGTAAAAVGNGTALERAIAAHPEQGGGAVPGHIATLPCPAWSQLIGDNPDGSHDIFQATDCGSQAVCMVTFACQHVELPEGIVREFIRAHFGEQGDGCTTPEQLAWYLSSIHNNFPHAHVERDDNAPGLIERIKANLRDGTLVLVLGEWYTGCLHWVVARGYDEHQLVYNDPWTGTSKAITWGAYVERVNQGALVVTRGQARYE